MQSVIESQIIAKSRAGQRFWSSARGGDVALCYLCGCAIPPRTFDNFPRQFDGQFQEVHASCYVEMCGNSETVDQYRVRMERDYPQGRMPG